MQRQHFYVSADKLPAARAELIRTLAAGDLRTYEKARKDYEVAELIKFSESPDIIPQHVRVLELIYPSGAFQRVGGEALYPLLETQHHFIRPLMSLLAEGRISAPDFNTLAAHSLSVEVFVLAARWDQAVDYRTSIALASLYPRHHLFIADDNHVFTKLDENGVQSRLIQAFMRFGLNDPQFKSVLDASKAHRWTE